MVQFNLNFFLKLVASLFRLPLNFCPIYGLLITFIYKNTYRLWKTKVGLSAR